MIITVIDAEVRQNKLNGNDYLALKVVDDYETKKFLFINPKADFYFEMVCKMAYVPVIRKVTGSIQINAARFIGKILSISEEKVLFNNKCLYHLYFDRWYYSESVRATVESIQP